MFILTVLLTISLLYLLVMVWKYKKIIREQADELIRIRLSDNFIDDITGTYNSKSIEHIIEERLHFARQKNLSVSFLMVDIDNFKRVNDAFGILKGDIVLKQLATIFAAELRGDDRLIRYRMGDEFIVIAINATGINAAKALGSRLKERAETFEWSMPPFHLNFSITISVGVTEYNGPAHEFTPALLLAEQALKSAKTRRNCVVLEMDGAFIPFK